MTTAKHRSALGLSRHCGWLLLGLVQCTGLITGSSGSSGQNGALGSSATSNTGSSTNGSSSGAGATAATTNNIDAFSCASSATPDPGPSPLRLLSRSEYLNTLQGLFGSVPSLDSALGTDPSYGAAFGLVQADVDPVALAGYQSAAETVAAAVVGNATALNAAAPCASGADQRTCAQTFVQTFGALAFRAPVTDTADIARHMALYDLGAKTSYAHGIELVLRGMLQSPRFLYRVEIGTTEAVGPSAVKLSGYEIAARLAYVVWDTLPDSALTAAAAAGALGTKDQIAAQLTRMLADPKGVSFVRRFLDGWTQVPSVTSAVKDATLYPEWTAMGSTLPSSLQGQADAFFDDQLKSQDGQLAALLTSPTVFVNKDLGSYYGTTGGSTFTALTLTNGQASGLLTLPALLTLQAKPNESWPIYRGKFVREQLLCEELPTPPPNIPAPPEVQPDVSTRERLSQHEVDPSCSGCHQEMDPIGFGFENYDAIGRYRTTDGGQPVDASGEIIKSADADGKFNGVVELGKRLAGSEEVRQCVTRQWFRFALSRFEQDLDGCSMKGILSAFESANSSLNALPQAIVQSDAFIYRRPIDFQEAP